MKSHFKIFSAFMLIVTGLSLIVLTTGCTTSQLNQAQVIGAALVQDVAQGTVVAGDAYAVYQSVNQNLTTSNVIAGKLTVAKVIAGAQAINQTVGSPATASLTLAANTFVADVNGQIAARLLGVDGGLWKL